MLKLPRTRTVGTNPTRRSINVHCAVVGSGEDAQRLLKRHGIILSSSPTLSPTNTLDLPLAQLVINIREERDLQTQKYKLSPSDLASRIIFLSNLGVPVKDIQSIWQRYGTAGFWFDPFKAATLIQTFLLSDTGGALDKQDIPVLLKRYPLFFKRHTSDSLRKKMDVLTAACGGMTRKQRRKLLLHCPQVFSLSSSLLTENIEKLANILPKPTAISNSNHDNSDDGDTENTTTTITNTSSKNVLLANAIAPAPGFNSCLIGQVDKCAIVVNWLGKRGRLGLPDDNVAEIIRQRPELLRCDLEFLEETFHQLQLVLGGEAATIAAIIKSPPLIIMAPTTVATNLEVLSQQYGLPPEAVAYVSALAPETFKMDLSSIKLQLKLQYYSAVLSIPPQIMLGTFRFRMLKYALERADRRVHAFMTTNALGSGDGRMMTTGDIGVVAGGLEWLVYSDKRFCDKIGVTVEWYNGKGKKEWRRSERAVHWLGPPPPPEDEEIF